MHHHAVLVLIYVKRAALVPACALARLGLAVHPPPAAHDALDVGSRARAAHRQQPWLGLRRGHPRQGAHLGVGQLAAGEGLGEQRQRPQRARHPHPFTGRAEVEPDPPAQPFGTGAEPVVPAPPRVELANQIEQPGGGGFEVRRQLGDLIAQLIEFRDVLRSGESGWRVNLHGALPSARATVHPDFGGPGSRQGERSQDEKGFGSGPLGWAAARPLEPFWATC